MKRILGRCVSSIRNWRLLVQRESEELERWVSELERSLSPPRLTWVAQWQSSLGNLDPAVVEANSRSVDGVLYDAPHVGGPVHDLLVPRDAPDATIVNLVSQE
jgi:hypothetical protein